MKSVEGCAQCTVHSGTVSDSGAARCPRPRLPKIRPQSEPMLLPERKKRSRASLTRSSVNSNFAISWASGAPTSMPKTHEGVLRPLIADTLDPRRIAESRLRHIFYSTEAGVGVRARLDTVMSMPFEV
jgi:hypothetical protein